ncbi:hypothetical protein F5Y10DRAFT_155277 [Nemania abortiva]|nr:hypothetical protein F5Y10DRAFT_155277 [Nemania abortiva]
MALRPTPKSLLTVSLVLPVCPSVRLSCCLASLHVWFPPSFFVSFCPCRSCCLRTIAASQSTYLPRYIYRNNKLPNLRNLPNLEVVSNFTFPSSSGHRATCPRLSPMLVFRLEHMTG